MNKYLDQNGEKPRINYSIIEIIIFGDTVCEVRFLCIVLLVLMFNLTSNHNEIPPFRTIIGSLFTLIWWILTLIYYKNVLNAYNSTTLPYSLLTIDSLFFAGIIAMIAVVISISGTHETYGPASTISNKLLTISGGVAILIITNISAYITTGLLHNLAIYYQIWR